MKRYGNLWDNMIDWDNLVLAARKAQRGKRCRNDVQRFNFFQEMQLLRLQEQLADGSYRPGHFHSHWISRPKPRLISAAPYRDRVAHHALMNVLEPILERHFHTDSYACRKGKGTHAAVDHLQKLMQRNVYALQCDIRKFFPSIDHDILKAKFRRLIKDKQILWLMDMIVDCSNKQESVQDWFRGDNLFTPFERDHGIPIGNLTSQWFANWFLNDLDHYITSNLGIGGYVRYCDDFILLHNDRSVLYLARDQIKEKLSKDRLRAHESKLFIRKVQQGITFVGYRIWPTHRLLRKDNVRAFRKRLAWMKNAYSRGEIEFADIKPRLDSWVAHAAHANSRRLLRRLRKDFRFKRAAVEKQPRAPRRQLEQQCEQLPSGEPQQEQPRQSQQQHRVSFCPALSDSMARNQIVHGQFERGIESPDSGPVLSGGYVPGSRTYVVSQMGLVG